jgi:GMP synthase (glutamine-hydrolysing)
MHIHFILHASFEKPGYIDTWIAKNGYTSSATSPYKGERLPSGDDFDFLIIMGGPQSPTNLTEFPYLKDEIYFTQKAIENNKSILGICLGAQIIGEALGAKTDRSPHKEVGAFPISLTPDGLLDPIFKHFPQQFEVMHWHNDMPGVPDAAVILAESAGCPRQVVRYGEKIYGLQCHLEMTPELIKEMLEHCKEDLRPSLYTQTREKMLAVNFSEINEKLHFILDKITK